MGWKSLRDHFEIKHIVHVTPDGVCIGSPYVHNLIVCSLDGKIVKAPEASSLAINDDLSSYLRRMRAEPAKVAELIRQPDAFGRSLPVFTYDDGVILEKFCEEYGWPNVTHDGCLMYDNTFSPDRAKVIVWARADLVAAVKFAGEHVARLEGDLAAARAHLEKMEGAMVAFRAANPGA